MASDALNAKIRGLSQAKAAFQALPAIVRERMLEATETTVREIARNAQAKIASSPSIRTRALYDAVKWQVTKTNGRGRVGIANATTRISSIALKKTITVKGTVVSSVRDGKAHMVVVQPTRYAHLVEFGAEHMPAEPFMIPAAEAEVQPFLQRCVRAGKDIEKDTAAIGLRGV